MKYATRVLLLITVFGVPIGLALAQSRAIKPNTVTLRARMAEAGGWSREVIEVTAGESYSFRLTSDDVVHGFTIARSDLEQVDIEPGKWTETSWTPELPGEYTYYCTRWCGPNHWRMTGTILVTDPTGTRPTPTSMPDPRYLAHELNIDDREGYSAAERIHPSAARGAALSTAPSLPWQDPLDPDLTTPAQAWESLRRDPALTHLDDLQLWDLLSLLWTSEVSSTTITAGREIYDANCTACHGAAGDGRGVMAEHFDDPPPADFTDLTRMATANNIMLEGKILRGGMGTSMPYWGSILTFEQIAALQQLIWQFTFPRD
jgi:mono/diheme cytochrome c family protein/plastocyanin